MTPPWRMRGAQSRTSVSFTIALCLVALRPDLSLNQKPVSGLGQRALGICLSPPASVEATVPQGCAQLFIWMRISLLLLAQTVLLPTESYFQPLLIFFKDSLSILINQSIRVSLLL